VAVSLFLLGAFVIPGLAQASPVMGAEALRFLPVQDAGRVKPFDTFARESLQLVYGAESFTSARGEKRPAIEIIFTWMLLPQYWDEQKIVRIDHKGLKDSLKLSGEEKYFSPKELFANTRLTLVMQELQAFSATKQKMTPYFSAAQTLESQLGTFQSIKNGQAVRVVPPTPEALKAAEVEAGSGGRPMAPQKWQAIGELQGEAQVKFQEIIHALVKALPETGSQDGAKAQVGPPADGSSLTQAVETFKSFARTQNQSLYPSDTDISIEVHVKTFHPFMITWILYLVAAILGAVSWHLGNRKAYYASWFVGVGAFLIHTYGFGLRIYLTGRPPVSNMYESVIWVSWGCFVFAMIFEALSKRRFVLISGALVGVICLIIADLAPTILDSSLQPLEPVLRSNMWLTIHVLTITLSYSAFFLAWGLGNLGIGFLLRGFNQNDERVRALVLSIYRCLQIGVVLLAAGTILGGIWADYSWGRFWGWDPKETWAFIALLGYLAILHGRLVGWVKNIGMLVTSIIGFNLVIMAWYGVNFVLGAGLHTYGMGAGGVQYVAAVVLLNILYVGYGVYVHSRVLQQQVR
jgi:cytochrome c-type biogenesis protein CcsB